MRGRFLFSVCPRVELVRLHDAHNLLSNHGRHNRRATRVNFRRKYTATREGPAQSLTLQGVCELFLECRHTRPPEPIMLSRVKRPARWHGLVPILLPSLDIDKKEGKAEEDIGPAGFADLCSAARQRPAPEDLGAEDSHLRDHQDETNGAPQSRRRELLEGAQGCFRRCSGLEKQGSPGRRRCRSRPIARLARQPCVGYHDLYLVAPEGLHCTISGRGLPQGRASQEGVPGSPREPEKEQPVPGRHGGGGS